MIVTREGIAQPPATHRPPPSWWPVAATLCAIAYALAYLAWQATGWGSQAVRDVVSNVAFMPMNAALCWLNWQASRRQELDLGVRRALRRLAIAAACVLVGNAISTFHQVVLQVSPAVSPADAFYLGDALFMAAAMLTFPVAARLRTERWKVALDASMVLVGGGVVIWYWAVRPTAALSGDALVTALLVVAFPLTSLLLLFAVTTVLLRRPLDGNRVAFRLLVAGILTSIVADLAFGVVQAETNVRGVAWTDPVYLFTYVLLIASAERYWRRPVPYAGREEGDAAAVPVASPLPYLAVAATYALLLRATLEHWNPASGPLALAAIGITLLVVVRQLLAVRQNVQLLAETAMRANEARFRSLVQNASDVIMVIDPGAIVRFASPSVERVLGYDAQRMLGCPVYAVLEPDQRLRAEEFVATVAQARGVSAPVEWRFVQPSGTPLHAEVIATNLLDDPSLSGIVLNLRDVSERKRLEQQLLHQAFHDPLTGLANRALFRDRVSHALTLARRNRRSIAVLFLDLDDFKKVNDSLGHAAGDRLLMAAAERFRSCARAVDTVARLGGDEFAILIEGVGEPEDHTVLVDRLQDAMAQPFMLGGTELFVNASVGIATGGGEESADELLRHADVAMYTAKRRGKGRFESYESRMSTDLRDRLELESAFRVALDRGQLVAHYQPIVSLRTGVIVGAEALVRWQHPTLGLLGPQEFIPLAEETGLITRVGAWILREACGEVASWRAAHPGRGLTVAVNVSGRQLLDDTFIEGARLAIADAALDPSALVLEITESVLMQQSGDVLALLRRFRSLGVGLAIDDFGTGYSSLSYLQRFPIDTLKIARPFIEELGDDSKAALARAIVGLGETLHLQTIAEGVEDAMQCAALIELGCVLGQGYFFAPPLAAPDFAALLHQPPLSVPGRLRAI